MNDKKIKAFLSQNQSIPMDENRKKKSIALLMEEVERAEFTPAVSMKEVFTNQLCYMSKSSFLIQLLAAAAGFYLLAVYGDSQLQRVWMQLSSVLPLLVIVSCTEIQKSFLDNMWELECACRYDLRTVISVRMAILSGVNLLILTLFSIMGSHQTQTFFFRTAVYLLVPFLLMNLLFFILLQKRRLSRFGLYTAGLAATLLFLFLSNTELHFLYESGLFAVWLLVLVIAAGFLAAAVYHFINGLKEDMVLWSSR